ncbi:hypothetical protein SprV_0501965700 [Sparganum proliferum]
MAIISYASSDEQHRRPLTGGHPQSPVRVHPSISPSLTLLPSTSKAYGEGEDHRRLDGSLPRHPQDEAPPATPLETTR